MVIRTCKHDKCLLIWNGPKHSCFHRNAEMPKFHCLDRSWDHRWFLVHQKNLNDRKQRLISGKMFRPFKDDHAEGFIGAGIHTNSATRALTDDHGNALWRGFQCPWDHDGNDDRSECGLLAHSVSGSSLKLFATVALVALMHKLKKLPVRMLRLMEREMFDSHNEENYRWLIQELAESEMANTEFGSTEWLVHRVCFSYSQLVGPTQYVLPAIRDMFKTMVTHFPDAIPWIELYALRNLIRLESNEDSRKDAVFAIAQLRNKWLYQKRVNLKEPFYIASLQASYSISVSDAVDAVTPLHPPSNHIAKPLAGTRAGDRFRPDAS